MLGVWSQRLRPHNVDKDRYEANPEGEPKE